MKRRSFLQSLLAGAMLAVAVTLLICGLITWVPNYSYIEVKIIDVNESRTLVEGNQGRRHMIAGKWGEVGETVTVPKRFYY